MRGGGELEGGWETHESHCEGEIDLTSQMDGVGMGTEGFRLEENGGNWSWERQLGLSEPRGLSGMS